MNYQAYSDGTIKRIDDKHRSQDVARVHFDKRTGRKWLYLQRDGKQVSTGIDVMHIWHRPAELYALVDSLITTDSDEVTP